MKHVLRRIGAIDALPDLPLGIKLPSRRLFPYFQSSSTPTIIEKLGVGSNLLAGRLDLSRGVVRPSFPMVVVGIPG